MVALALKDISILNILALLLFEKIHTLFDRKDGHYKCIIL